MAPPRGTKRKSDETADHVGDAPDLAPQAIATKKGSSSGQNSPRKKQKTGISLGQKQALIDNLQLESTWSQCTRRPGNEQPHLTRL